MKAWIYGLPLAENDVHLICSREEEKRKTVQGNRKKREQNNRVRRRCCYEIIIIIKHERVCGGFYCRSHCAWDLRL